MYQNPVAGQRQNPLEFVRSSLFFAVFLLLPVIGLVAGPSYAPMLFGLAGVSALLVWAARRQGPALDRPAAAIALLFLLVCAAGLIDTFSPRLTEGRLWQMIGISAGGLLLVAAPLGEAESRRLFPLLFWSIAAGMLLLAADTALGYPLQHALVGPAANIGVKYNRGIIGLVMIFWPAAANLAARGERRRALMLFAIVLAGALVGLSATGLGALVIGSAVWLAALKFPRAAAAAVGFGMTGLGLALPWLLRLASAERPQLAKVMKWTGIHRLEIWDYMSARILERPLSGWGLGVAKVVPIRAEELATYLYADASGIYPHNQWIELWLETGFFSVVLALALLWLALRRARGRFAPFQLAAIASALTVSLLNFEITTDSWWAALAASALLFKLLPKEAA